MTAAPKAVRFGYCLPIFATPGGRLFRTPAYAALDPATTFRLGVTADELGYDSLWVADHLFLGRDGAILEGWTTLCALAGATRQARLGMIHMAHLLRFPSLVAKMAATLDQLSGGRLIHFIDGGNRREEFERYGLPWVEPIEDRIARMEDGLRLTLALWTQEGPVDYDGPHFRLRGAVCRPRPRQRPHPPVWLGEAHPAMLAVCARLAQGWNSVPVGLPEMKRRLSALEAACAEAGRPCGQIEKSLEVQVLVAPSMDEVRRRLRAMVALDPPGAADAELAAFLDGQTDRVPEALVDTTLVGTPEQVADRVQAYLDLGVTHFLLWFLDAPDEAGLRLFIDRVAPRFR